jgi:hypothetical protein
MSPGMYHSQATPATVLSNRPALGQFILAASVSEPAEVPDPHKPPRKDMLQEAASSESAVRQPGRTSMK